jgi:hypothetical protein
MSVTGYASHTCSRCGTTASHPEGIAQRYCRVCHAWAGAAPPEGALELYLSYWVPGLRVLPVPPPWYLPVAEPACGIVLAVPATDAPDGYDRVFTCDRAHGHPDQHRAVIDNTTGNTISW